MWIGTMQTGEGSAGGSLTLLGGHLIVAVTSVTQRPPQRHVFPQFGHTGRRFVLVSGAGVLLNLVLGGVAIGALVATLSNLATGRGQLWVLMGFQSAA